MPRALPLVTLCIALTAGWAAAAQPPKVLPPASRGQATPPKPAEQPPATPAAPAPPQPVRPAGGEQAPTEATLGLPIYPGALFLASYDAGRDQRYYLFGTTASFADVVAYYKSVLQQKGDLVFEEPPTQMFEVSRFREDTMAFPPGVTVKDYTWGGMKGYPNPKLGTEPARFATVVQIVPIPAAPAR
jgi:hypothetical protein